MRQSPSQNFSLAYAFCMQIGSYSLFIFHVLALRYKTRCTYCCHKFSEQLANIYIYM